MIKSYFLSKNGYINSLINIPENFRVNKNTNCIKITTETGLNLIIEEGLSIKILTKEGKIDFKKAEELSVEDVCLTAVKSLLFSNNNSIEEKKAYIIGILYAFRIDNENLNFDLIKGSISDYIGDFLYRYLKVLSIPNKYSLQVPIDFIYKNNISKNEVPEFIFSGNKETQISFLRGFFDCNSIIFENKIIKDLYSNELLQQISLMLKNLGIISEIDNYDIIISGQEIISFYNIVGTFNSDYEEEILNVSLKETDFYEILNLKQLCLDFYETTDKEDIDFKNFKFTRTNILNLIKKDGDEKIKNKLKELLSENICFDRIVSIEKIISDSIVIITCDIDTYIMNSFFIKK